MNTWRELDTYRGRLIEMAAVASSAKSDLTEILLDFPADFNGWSDLEEAIGIIGRVVDEFDSEIDRVEDTP